MNKYRAKQTICGKNHLHPSKKEAFACNLLSYMEKTGKIKDLKQQPEFELQPKFKGVDGKNVRAITYRADFSFYDIEQGKHRVIDIKGFITPVYALKRKLFDYIMLDRGIMLETEI